MAIMTSDFEGYSGMLVFTGFMPAGIVFGAVLGAAGLGYLASRDEAS
jgi:predicted branched-subunit amino acid permease